MKLQVRVIVILCVAFILVVSFKILEPELQEHPGGVEIVPEQDYVAVEENFVDLLKPDDVEITDHVKDVGVNGSETNIKRLCKLYDVDLSHKPADGRDPFLIADSWVSSRSLHPEFAPEIGSVLHLLSTLNITHADVGYKGTQLKLTLVLEGNHKVIFKPQWFSRDHVIRGRPYDGADRHNAEMVAFHLNRLLDYRRVPLVAGRRIDLVKDIVPVASTKLLKTFFNNGSNVCFYGQCLYCRSKADGVCANGTSLEGAVVNFLPDNFQYTKRRHPWQRTYVDNKKARWEKSDDYCSLVESAPLYSHTPLFLDMMDASVMDYLIGNADRHHYEVFKDQPDSMLLMWDNGKAFGNPYHDERSILAPIYQCCRIRRSTWDRLQQLKNGALSGILRCLLRSDPLSPLLSDPHYSAMDRRLVTILQTVHTCVQQKGEDYVFVDDQYTKEKS